MTWTAERKILVSTISEGLKNIGAIKKQEVRLASGESSNFYIDLRLIFGNPKIFGQFLEALEHLIQEEIPKFDGIAGVPTAGLPLATGMALKFHKPLFYTRAEVKGHGLQKKIEGGNVKNLELIVVDDLISSGHSKLPVINSFREAGAIVNDIVVLIDRELGGSEAMKEQNVRLQAVAKLSELAL